MPRGQYPINEPVLKKLCEELSRAGAEYSGMATKLREQGGGPLVEDIGGKPDSKNKKVTFFYYAEDKDCSEVNIRSQLGFLPNVMEQCKKGEEGWLPTIPMRKIAEHVWEFTVDELPKEACFTYSFDVKIGAGVKGTFDPINPQIFLDSFNNPSVCDLSPPTFSSQAALNENRIRKYAINSEGALRPLTEIESNDYVPEKDERILTVHFPPGYNQDGTKYPMRLFLDGGAYAQSMDVPSILDDGHINIMLEPKRINVKAPDEDNDRVKEYRPNGYDLFLMSGVNNPPKISDEDHLYLYKDKERFYYKIQGKNENQYLEDAAIKNLLKDEKFDQPAENPIKCANKQVCDVVLKETSTRGHTHRPDEGGDAFTKLLSTVLVPKMQNEFHVSELPENNTICGSSLSGYAATSIGLHHPEIFGNVLAQSSALWLFWPQERSNSGMGDSDSAGTEHLTKESLQEILLQDKKIDWESLKNSCFYLEVNQGDHPKSRIANTSFENTMRDMPVSCHLTKRDGNTHEGASWNKFLKKAADNLHEMASRRDKQARYAQNAHPTSQPSSSLIDTQRLPGKKKEETEKSEASSIEPEKENSKTTHKTPFSIIPKPPWERK